VPVRGRAAHRFDARRFCNRPVVGAVGIGAPAVRLDAFPVQG